MASQVQLESYSQEIQKQWLSGKIYSLWRLEELQSIIPDKQVLAFILFQVEAKARNALQSQELWDFSSAEAYQTWSEFIKRLHAHIAIPYIHLTQLLSTSIYNTLRLIVYPQATLEQFFFSQQEHLAVHQFEHYAGYVRYFDFVPAALLAYAKQHVLTHITKELYQEKWARILELFAERTPIETYQNELLQKFGDLSLQKLSQTKEGQLVPDLLSEMDRNLFGTVVDTKPSNLVDKARNPLLSAVDISPREIIAQKLAQTKDTPLHETLKRFDTDSLPVHKQFSYIQKVFEGDPIAFRRVMEELDRLSSWSEAQKYLEKSLSPSADPKVKKEFLDWVQSRY
ncbi:MAG: hypothetical protein ACUVRD_00075 [Bacteroidia bacterium]